MGTPSDAGRSAKTDVTRNHRNHDEIPCGSERRWYLAPTVGLSQRFCIQFDTRKPPVNFVFTSEYALSTE